jgi:hypothetical protein
MEDSKQVAHLHAHFRVWKRRFYELNIWTAKKRDEKLHYMHNNPVKRGLVKEPGDWPWSRRGGAILFPGRRLWLWTGNCEDLANPGPRTS